MFKIFAQTFQESIYSKEFYRDLPSQPVSASVSYYFILILFASVIFTVVTGVGAWPTVNNFVKTAGPTIIKSFPEDLVIEIKNGQATHNKEEPVAIPFPSDANMPWRNAVVVDTKSPFSLNKLREHDTLFVLTEDSLAAYENDRGQVRIYPLKDMPNITINRRQIVSWIDTIEPFLGWLIPVMFLVLFIAGLLIYTSFFIRIILASLLIWLFYRLRKNSLPFKRAYQTAIHASTLAFVISGIILMFIPFDLPSLPFLFTIITVIVAVVNFTHAEPTPSA